MITDEHDAATIEVAEGRTFTLRDHVIAQLDHVRPEERQGVLDAAAAFARGEVEGTRLPGPEPYFRLRAAPELLVFVERRPGVPVEVFDIARPATLRMFADAALTE